MVHNLINYSVVASSEVGVYLAELMSTAAV